MKQCIITITAILLLHTVYGQQQGLTLPGSPAFSIVNFEPSAVMRPSNVKSLSTDILNAFDKNGQLVMNTGIEAAPYWLTSHSNLTLQQYLKPNLIHTIKQSLSLSAATVKDSATGYNKLGVGFRFKLYNGEPVTDANTIANLKSLKTQTTIAAILNGFAKTALFENKQKAMEAVEAALLKKLIAAHIVQQLILTAHSIENDFDDTPAGISEFLNQLNIRWINGLKQLQEAVTTQLYQRKGLIVELAGAGSFNTSKNNGLEKTGIWLNMSYFVSADDLFTCTIRQLYTKSDTTFSALDAALSFSKKSNKFTLAVEAALRKYRSDIPDFNLANVPIIRTEKKTTYRFAIQSSFVLNEQISLSLSFGKDFDTPFIQKKGFFSLLGFNYSIFNKTIEQLK